MAEGGPTVRVEARLDERGYRRVLVAQSARRLRFALPLSAFFGFGALAAGRTAVGASLLVLLIGTVLVAWGVIAWRASAPSNRHLYDPIAYEFAATGIGYGSVDGRGAIGWDQLVRWDSVADHLVLYVTGGTFLLVPWDDVGDDQEVELRSMLRQHVRRGPRGRAR